MNNVLFEPLPEEWNGYKLNTWFQIGIQLSLVFDDDSLSDEERAETILTLLFGEPDGSIREFPNNPDELNQCLEFFMGGWFHDNTSTETKNEKIMDYDVDQWRIYSDFRQIYNINLNESDMHWWEFQALLWNMPQELSSFKQVLSIRTKKPSKHASAEEKKAIREGQHIYSLKKRKAKTEFTETEKTQIDAYDEMMRKMKEKKQKEEEFLKEFRK